MHSSCIVVRLDWAAGLPAWLIRRFGSPDLTRKTSLRQSRSLRPKEDRWLTLSMNIYQFVGKARRHTNPPQRLTVWPGHALSATSTHE